MKLSLDWLSDFVQFTENDPQKIADALSVQVAEIDEVEHQGKLLEHCCVGKVLTIKKHPNADKLSLCDVKTDKGTKHVVCGGTNVREGMHVAFAHIGAQVCWHGEELMTLSKTKIRGEESEGMICAAEELGLGTMFPECTGHNIIDLDPAQFSVGVSLREALHLNDTIFHVDNHAITHRPDLFSHVGFARECVAIGVATWKAEPAYALPKFSKDPLPFKINVKDKTIVPRYLGCMLHLDDIPETPSWMKKRLEATGWRSINLPIDITNYVTMEVGMPLHSFDAADIAGDIQIRTTKKGESIRTLDEIERELPEGAVVLSDKNGIFDLLGIMGGLRSSTKNTTKDIFLHAAVVDRKAIRKTILATGHRTDAATIYEKGIPKITAEYGFARALELFTELIPAIQITSQLDSWGDNGTSPHIPFSFERCQSLLGIDIPEKKVLTILQSIGCNSSKLEAGSWKLEAPLWRSDLHEEHDLIEEVGRVYGYNEISSTLPSAPCLLPKRDNRIHLIRHALKEQGYMELLPLSIIGPDLLQRCTIDPKNAPVIANAFGEDESLLQPSTLPQLFAHAQKNLRHAHATLPLFTVGHVFTNTCEEHAELGLLLVQKDATTDLKQNATLLLKHALSMTINSDVWSIKNTKKALPYAHPGQCADVMLEKTVIGQIFTLHPDICTRFGLPANTAAATLNLDLLLAKVPHETMFTPLPLHPAITYDETMTRSHTDSAQDMLETCRKESALLEAVSVADLYEGPPLKNGQYNLTLRFTYRAKDRTLKEEEAKKEHEKVMKKIA